METILSILIPSLPERKHLLDNLLRFVSDSAPYKNGLIQVIYDDAPRGELTTGAKRNKLKAKARGPYIWFVDDDDEILPGALEAILEATNESPDVISINGIMTTDGKDLRRWYIAIDNPYKASSDDKGQEIYLRYPNHITPMRLDKVKDIHFPDLSNFEDKAYADSIKEAKVLKTEGVVNIPVYHYKYSTRNKAY